MHVANLEGVTHPAAEATTSSMGAFGAAFHIWVGSGLGIVVFGLALRESLAASALGFWVAIVMMAWAFDARAIRVGLLAVPLVGLLLVYVKGNRFFDHWDGYSEMEALAVFPVVLIAAWLFGKTSVALPHAATRVGGLIALLAAVIATVAHVLLPTPIDAIAGRGEPLAAFTMNDLPPADSPLTVQTPDGDLMVWRQGPNTLAWDVERTDGRPAPLTGVPSDSHLELHLDRGRLVVVSHSTTSRVLAIGDWPSLARVRISRRALGLWAPSSITVGACFFLLCATLSALVIAERKRRRETDLVRATPAMLDDEGFVTLRDGSRHKVDSAGYSPGPVGVGPASEHESGYREPSPRLYRILCQNLDEVRKHNARRLRKARTIAIASGLTAAWLCAAAIYC